MSYETLILSKEDYIGTVTLNRPDKLNALTAKMGEELRDAFMTFDQDKEVRVVVITGAGKAFCAGADIQGQFTAEGAAGKEETLINRIPNEFIVSKSSSLANLRKPTIASINGAAIGFGFTMSLVCDIRLASETAKFSLPFARMGILPEWGSSYNLPRLVGIAKACELCFTAKVIDAKEALDIGLVNQVVPADKLKEVTYAMAKIIADMPPKSMELTKKALYMGMKNDLPTQTAYETLALHYLLGTEDHIEGAKAFLEKRKPVFKGK
ncbi:MAG: enoyl-CoA hydratase-related protein [Dehalococcoidia bacterium]|nr:enoyl-CoA hydratase-related protein [Dehalococcoidia bacterium]